MLSRKAWWGGASDAGREGHWVWGSGAAVGDFVWASKKTNLEWDEPSGDDSCGNKDYLVSFNSNKVR